MYLSRYILAMEVELSDGRVDLVVDSINKEQFEPVTMENHPLHDSIWDSIWVDVCDREDWNYHNTKLLRYKVIDGAQYF